MLYKEILVYVSSRKSEVKVYSSHLPKIPTRSCPLLLGALRVWFVVNDCVAGGQLA